MTVAATQTLSYGAGGGEIFLNDLAVGGAQGAPAWQRERAEAG